MALVKTVDTWCTNKLCEYEGSMPKVVAHNGLGYPLIGDSPYDIKTPCPQCRFKTLESGL